MTSQPNSCSSGVWLVIHELRPTSCMCMHEKPYTEEVETVNAIVVSVHLTERGAEQAAESHFDELRLPNNGDSENGGYYYNAGIDNADCHTWDEHVYVEYRAVST